MFPSIPCRWKVLGICAEGFWIRANFLFGVRWLEGHRTCKINLVNFVQKSEEPILRKSLNREMSKQADIFQRRFFITYVFPTDPKRCKYCQLQSLRRALKRFAGVIYHTSITSHKERYDVSESTNFASFHHLKIISFKRKSSQLPSLPYIKLLLKTLF